MSLEDTPNPADAPLRRRASDRRASDLVEREGALRLLGTAIETRSEALAVRLAEVVSRETGLGVREIAVLQREDAASLLDVVVTELERHNAELREANEQLVLAKFAADQLRDEAHAVNRRQEEFLAMLAHELRNPLAPIRAIVELIARRGDKPVEPRSLDIIRRQVRHMVQLVDDLLDASRVTHGKITLQRRAVDIAEAVRQAVDTCSDIVASRRQRLTLELPAKSPWVDADPVRLAQVFTNLLHNAAKYTQEGGDIRIALVAPGPGVEVHIRDNGAGISPEMLPRVFDLFAQDERAFDRAQGGLGIGLTVVRRMVELHGGSVEARSEGRNLGSEFIVRLPRIDVEAGPPQVSAAPRASGAMAPVAARILLVEDNADNALVFSDLLRFSGHEVQHALDGPSALECFGRWRPHVVLCDIGLVGMSGYELAEALRSIQAEPAPLLVALTGYGSRQDIERALAAGFDAHFTKPVDHESLLRLIDAALRRDQQAA